jgi:heptaprenyl diphosphate synthase
VRHEVGGTLSALAIFDAVQSDLQLVEDAIRRVGQVEYPLLASLLDHILQTRGKRVRPALVLLSASFERYELEYLVPLAAAIELLHTATLVHDDLIDNSPTRRGVKTLNSLTSKAATVLVGDYLFARAAALCTETENVRVLRVFGEALMDICDGELKQLFSSGDWRQTREQYYAKIEQKTASLLRTASETGAILSGAPAEWVNALRQYGLYLGMAFQIVDDVLDYVGDEARTGKPVGGDLHQLTITLPGIRLLEEDPENAELRRVFEDGDTSDEAIAAAVAAVKATGAIDFALDDARRFARMAVAELSVLPDLPARRSLAGLADYVVERFS